MGIFEDTHEGKALFGRRECLLCGKEFWKNSDNQKYCSSTCGSRKRRKDNPRDKKIGLQRLRFEILKRDNFTCQYCGRNPKEDKIKLQVDHITPESKGGEWKEENLITSCEDCNNGKSDVLLSLRAEKYLKKECVPYGR